MEEKKQGMKVIPMGERKCIWMDAGVVSYKLCTNHYQCNTCEFDLAMSNRAKQTKVSAQENIPASSSKKPVVEWMEEFRHLSAEQRKCRYMLSGDVAHKICPNSFRCGECSFDQMMQDRIQPVMTQEMDTVPKVAGFYLPERLYYFRNHTWLYLERNGKFRVGIDDFARRLIGKANSLELPAVGKNLQLEEYSWVINHEYGDLEFFSPVEGVVNAVNQKVLDDPDILTDKPFTDGWLFEIDPKSVGKSLKNLLQDKEASAWMTEEASLLNKSLQAEAGETLHDGAVVVNDISSKISQEKWNALVKNHLHTK
jgi:glycine cleavage system H lipoate-binding protein